MKTPLMPVAIALTALPLTIHAQDADPFSANPAGVAVSAADDNPFSDDADGSAPREPRTIEEGLKYNIEVCYESFSLPLAKAAALRRMALADSDLYARIVKMVSEEDAKQERFTLLRVEGGQRASTESIAETIYPTEFEPPELPNTVGVQIVDPTGKDAPAQVPKLERLEKAPPIEAMEALRTPATPTAFETRNLGHSLEVEPILLEDFRSVQMRIAPDNVTVVDECVAGQGLSETRMPEFESQKLSVGVVVKSGVPHLLGTVSRPPLSKADPDSANTTWFAFVTARPVVPE